MWQLAVLVLWLGLTQTAAQSAESCFADVDKCLPEFRSRYLTNDHFWFGTPYTSLCPGSPFCMNINPGLQSVMSRLLWTNNTALQQAAVSNVKILHVSFEQPGGRYFACDTWIEVAPSPPVKVNPLGPTLLSQLTVQGRPHVTWTPRTPDTLYTVMMVDLSYIYLHAVYINCAGGAMDTGEAVMQWMGSSVVYLVNSPYTFLVYEQTSRIPLATANKAVADTRAEGAAFSPLLQLFPVGSFLQKLTAYVKPVIEYSVIMEMYPDPYGSSRLTNFFGTVDQCPLFYSQLPTFHSAVEGMQIPDPKWSPPAFSLSQVSLKAHLTSIRVKVEVTYHTDDYTDIACCRKFTITRGSYAISPLDSRPVRAAVTRNAPRVFLSPVNMLAATGGGRAGIASHIYTFLMADVTPALVPNAAGPVLTVHSLVANIFGSDFETGTIVANYIAPSPTSGKNQRTYMFLLFEQSAVVNPSVLLPFCGPGGFDRCELKVTDLIREWGLGEIVGVNWFLSEFDGYALKQLYTNIRAEEKVCNGRKGYSKPCPPSDC